jgi:DNA-binding MarR family transcriptional regulator
MRIQKLNAQTDPIKEHEYKLIDAIARDSNITQAGLSSQLGIAVGSVNWYIKRLINRGYVKVSHLDRTRLQYDLTTEGMKIFTQRALQYMKDSLKVYNSLRSEAKKVVSGCLVAGVRQVFLEGDGEVMDILRLTCIEAGIAVDGNPEGWVLRPEGQGYGAVPPPDSASVANLATREKVSA